MVEGKEMACGSFCGEVEVEGVGGESLLVEMVSVEVLAAMVAVLWEM